jgi:hypothetical protein
MNDPYDSNEERLRFARYLARISAATRAIGVLAVIGAVIGLLVAMSMRRADDRLGFSLIAMTVALFGILVWGTGVFHGAVGRTIPTLVRIDRSLITLIGLSTARRGESHQLETSDGPPALPAPAEVPAVTASPEPAREEWPSEPITEPRVEDVQGAPSRLEVPEEVVKTPCPLCGGLIHPQATRCVHCMKKIAR